MPSSSMQLSSSSPALWRPLGTAESLLVAYAEQQHEKSTGCPVLGGHLAALKGAEGADGAPLADLPAPIYDSIAAHLDAKASASLTQLWGGRLRLPAKQTMLNRAATIYGFASSPGAGGWQAHLTALASSAMGLPPATDIKADAALAGLLLGTLTPCQVAMQCHDNREVVMRAVEQNGLALMYASAVLQCNREVVMRAVEQNGTALRFASAVLRGDREVAMRAVEQNGLALEFASAVLRGDREVAMRAVEQNGAALASASAALQGDREVVMRAVKQNGWTLRYVSAVLQGNREVVMRAVKQNGLALRFAGAVLQGNCEVVMRAVKQNGLALRFASAVLQSNREVVVRAIEHNGRVLQHASAALKNDPELRRLAGYQA